MAIAQSVSEDALHALIDGEAAAAEARWLAGLVEADPALAARAHAYRAQREDLHRLYDRIAEEPLPERFRRLFG